MAKKSDYVLSRRHLEKLSTIINSSDIALIASKVLNKTYTDVFFSRELVFSAEEYARFIEFVYRRFLMEPISKIIESKEFYGIEYITNKDTLDPRPETELIIDLVLKYFDDRSSSFSILDLGSGTGCLSLTLLSKYRSAVATIVDISNTALNISMQNAKKLHLSDRCEFMNSNWFENVSGEYDIIVSNPPYISSKYKLDRSALYDPQEALLGGVDGLDHYRIIMPNVHKFLKNTGVFFIEIGVFQCNDVKKLAKNLDNVEVAKDISGIERVLVFKKCDLDEFVKKGEFVVYLTPGAKVDAIHGIVYDENQKPMLKVSVSARPNDNQANEALIKLLSREFNVSKSRISIKSGNKSRKKLIVIKQLFLRYTNK